MTITAALRQARGEVSLNRFGNQWTVTVWSELHKAWWEDSAPGSYWCKRAKARDCVIRHTLRALGWDNEAIDTAECSRAWETGAARDVVKWFAKGGK